jgi:hypothetical protein
MQISNKMMIAGIDSRRRADYLLSIFLLSRPPLLARKRSGFIFGGRREQREGSQRMVETRFYFLERGIASLAWISKRA